MTEYTEMEAVRYCRDLLEDNLDPTPQPSPTGYYVWPEDYDLISGELNLPIVIVRQKVAVGNDWVKKSGGHSKHEWLMEIYVLLAKGPLKYPNDYAADVEALQTHWAQAVATVLYLDLDLGGRVGIIGQSAGGGQHRIFTYWVEHSQWNQQVYWSVRFILPVFQFHTLTIGGV